MKQCSIKLLACSGYWLKRNIRLCFFQWSGNMWNYLDHIYVPVVIRLINLGTWKYNTGHPQIFNEFWRGKIVRFSIITSFLTVLDIYFRNIWSGLRILKYHILKRFSALHIIFIIYHIYIVCMYVKVKVNFPTNSCLFSTIGHYISIQKHAKHLKEEVFAFRFFS